MCATRRWDKWRRGQQNVRGRTTAIGMVEESRSFKISRQEKLSTEIDHDQINLNHDQQGCWALKTSIIKVSEEFGRKSGKKVLKRVSEKVLLVGGEKKLRNWIIDWLEMDINTERVKIRVQKKEETEQKARSDQTRLRTHPPGFWSPVKTGPYLKTIRPKKMRIRKSLETVRWVSWRRTRWFPLENR